MWWITFLFSLLCLMKNNVWLFPCETLETALVGWVREDISWYCCCGHKLNPLASQRIVCVAIDYYIPSRMRILIFFFSEAFETIAYANNSGVVCVLLSKNPFFVVASSLSGFGTLSIYFPFRLCAEMLYKCSGFDRVKVLTTKCHSP